MHEIDHCGCDFPKCHYNDGFFRLAQNNASHQDPDINIAPSADQADDAIEKTWFNEQFLSWSVNASFANAIERLSHDEQSQIEESIWELARDIEVIRQCCRPDD